MDRYINLRVIASLERIRLKRSLWFGDDLAYTPAWDILCSLYKMKEGASVSVISEELHISAELILRWFNILQDRALVERSRMRDAYSLTAKGIEAVADVLSVSYDGNEGQLHAC